MRLSELRLCAEPYSSATVIHRGTGRPSVVYVTEDRTYDVIGIEDEENDRKGLTKLELAALLADYDPDPDDEPAGQHDDMPAGRRP